VRERRDWPRVPVREPCRLTIGQRHLRVTIENLSEQGCLVHVSQPSRGGISDADLGQEAIFTLASTTPARRYTGEIIRRYFAEGADHFALRFWKRFEELPVAPGEAAQGGRAAS